MFKSTSSLEEDSKEIEKAVEVKGFTLQHSTIDAQGYFQPRIGEILDERFKITSIAGKGVFSCVVKAYDQDEFKEVAIKIIRAQSIMRDSGLRERAILSKFSAGIGNRRFILKMISSFEHQQHLCLVLEPLKMNLRELLNEYGKGVGLSMDAVRLYAK